MTKSKDGSPRNDKKAPAKNLKEKRAVKAAKKAEKNKRSEL